VEPARIEDVGFIIDSWCADENVYVGRPDDMDPEIFKVEQRARVRRLLSSCPAVVARPTPAYWQARGEKADPNRLFGWIVYTFDRATLKPLIHFTYVKGEHRRQGVCAALLHAAGYRAGEMAWASHCRLKVARRMKSKGIIYNRFLLDYDPTQPGAKG
jgi:hypothetical protein